MKDNYPPTLLTSGEPHRLARLAKQAQRIEGDFAEVGVYQGGSAAILCEVKGDKTLHLFDTFEGIPKVSEIDKDYYVGQFAANIEDVKQNLSKFPKIKFHKGIFPDTAGAVAQKRFAFVHIDVDTYESTIACLKFFYHRVNKGGLIVIHDYHCDSIKKAIDEFLVDKQQKVNKIGVVFCLIVKRE